MKSLAEQIPLLALFSAVAHAGIFVLFGRLSHTLFILPLLTLITLLSLPILYVWSVYRNRTFNILLSSRQMLTPVLLSFLLFPGFLFLFSKAYMYSDSLKLVLIYLCVVLIFEVGSQKGKKSVLILVGTALVGLLVLSIILSQGLTLWPLLWAEGAMALAAVSICLYRIFLGAWCKKTLVSQEAAHFWSVVWTLPWLLTAMWISGKGLPLPPVPQTDLIFFAIWGGLYHLAMIIIESYRNKTGLSGDFLLILFFFLPAFVTILGFLESAYWPDYFDVTSYLFLLLGVLLLYFSNRNTPSTKKNRTEEKGAEIE